MQLAVGTRAKGRYHRDYAFPEKLFDRARIHFSRFTHESPVERLARRFVHLSLLDDREDLLAVQALCPCALLVEHCHDTRVYLGFHDFLNDLHGFLARNAVPFDEPGLDAVLGHAAGNGLTAAMDDHRQHADALHERDIREYAFFVRGILHGAAAELHDYYLVAKLLHVRQCLYQNGCFLDHFLHIGPLFVSQVVYSELILTYSSLQSQV